MPYFYYWNPKLQRWFPTKQLLKLLDQSFKPPKQHGKRKMFNNKPVKS